MPIRRNKTHSMPMLNTSSLPDLIFTVLFFFMIVTHMRKVTVKVQYRVPQGTELTRLIKKSAVSYIYIGKPVTNSRERNDSLTLIQLNDKLVTSVEIAGYILAERESMPSEDQRQMTVVIRADRDTKMKTITEVKQALRQAKVTNINYSAVGK